MHLDSGPRSVDGEPPEDYIGTKQAREISSNATEKSKSLSIWTNCLISWVNSILQTAEYGNLQVSYRT